MLSLEELNQFYRHTYLRLKPTNTVILMDVIDYKSASIIFTSHSGTLTLTYPECLDLINFHSPETGYFNYRTQAYYLYKYPLRQWKRGFCNTTHEAYNPLRRLLHQGFNRFSIGWSSAEEIFNRKFKSIVNDNKKDCSWAINSNLMISKSPTIEPFNILWYQITPVGIVADNKIIVKDSNFEQEIHDELKQIDMLKWIA